MAHIAAEAAVRKEAALWEDRQRVIRASVHVIVASTLDTGAKRRRERSPTERTSHGAD